MKILRTIPIVLFTATSVFAGDAPNDMSNGVFDSFFDIKAEAFVNEGNCEVQASAANVFDNEITANVDVATDLAAIGFPNGSALNTADARTNWSFDTDPCNDVEEGLQLDIDEVFFGTKTNLSDGVSLTLANTFNFEDETFSPELSIEGNFGKVQLKESKQRLMEC